MAASIDMPHDIRARQIDDVSAERFKGGATLNQLEGYATLADRLTRYAAREHPLDNGTANTKNPEGGVDLVRAFGLQTGDKPKRTFGNRKYDTAMGAAWIVYELVQPHL